MVSKQLTSHENLMATQDESQQGLLSSALKGLEARINITEDGDSMKGVTFMPGLLPHPGDDAFTRAEGGNGSWQSSDPPSLNSSGISTPANPVDGLVVAAAVDPWALPDILEEPDGGKTWHEMDTMERLRQVLVGYILKAFTLLGLLYLFICSLGLLTDSFRLLGGRAAGEVFKDSTLLSNPICGLMIGVLATVLLQSSSTSTSIIVGMVAADILKVRVSIPMVMGANIGTSMTNTVVSVAHSGRRNEFRRAFAGATVHDMFNWLCVLVLLPAEVLTGYLYHTSKALVGAMHITGEHKKPPKLLKVLTEPLTQKIIRLDSNKIRAIAMNEIDENDDSFTLIKHDCSKTNATIKSCGHLFVNTTLSDTTVGVLLLVVSLILLISCLVLIVKLLSSILKGQVARVIRKTINNDLPPPFGPLTGYLHILIGAVMTILVQSSSVFTSALTPLVGIGVLSLDRMYPLTLGANVGTTFTSLLAALASPPSRLESALQISLCHLLFNMSGIFLFYVIPFFRPFPVRLAMILGDKTSKYRWFALVYVAAMFFIVPAATFGLSLAGSHVTTGVGLPCVGLMLLIVLINVVQVKCPRVLPKWLRSWQFLPKWMHSLEPFDAVLTKIGDTLQAACPFCLSGWSCFKAADGGDAVTKLANQRAESRRGLLSVTPNQSVPSFKAVFSSRSASPAAGGTTSRQPTARPTDEGAMTAPGLSLTTSF